ncbi:MAG TPA: thioredoxin domain-containing protein [Candidatus Angelobacter sp.]|nr:thioredoxin domain-containing protein [Candidatus Angelobacter sp.]
MTKLNTLAFISFALIATAVSAQTAAPKKPAANNAAAAPAKPSSSAPGSRTALPTNADVDAYMKRSFGYDPGVSWQIISIRESAVPGLAEIIVSINRGEPNHLYFFAPSQIAFVGQTLPFGPNPFAATRTTLQDAFGPARGGDNSPIQIVEFSDLQCPHCKAAQPIVEKLAADFPQVRFTFQQFPLPASLHPWAMKAAQYADCAGQMNKDAFWKYINAIFENQGGIALATADDKLKELATANGLDAAKISACAASPETDARIKKSLALGESLNVNQTPTTFINGRMVLGIASIPYDSLKGLVQFEIDHAGK